MEQLALKVMTMTDNRTKQKAIKCSTWVDATVANTNEQKLTVIRQMDKVVVVKRLKKVEKVDIVSVGPAKEEEEEVEKKEEKKEEKEEEKK